MTADRAGDGLFDGPAFFRGIPTRWSILKGPPRAALDYLARAYGRAILSYLRGHLVRGHYAPLGADDGDDVFQDFFLRLGSTEWLTKPDPARGPFRPYFIRKLKYFLDERRKVAIQRSGRAPLPLDEGVEPAELDPLDAILEKEWKRVTVLETIERIRKRRPHYAEALTAYLERGDRSHADLARSLGMTLDGFNSVLRRARALFRQTFPLVDRRLDGFGGQDF